MAEELMEKIVNLCKRRGFVFQSSEIYGGFRSTYDYGPLGVELKRNVKAAWWKAMVQDREDIVGLDASILMHPKVWVASGHVGTFTDPLVDCKVCHERFRFDRLEDTHTCPNCGAKDSFTDERDFNLMFETFVGPIQDEGAKAYLRPETAQGIFVNFKNVVASSRKKIPFGIAQIGKSFRNEITPGNFVFRTREFEQMEMEFFVQNNEGESAKWYEYWCQERLRWYVELGIPAEDLRLRQHEQDELSHYSIGTSDINYRFPFGWDELEGIAQRTDFDLNAHTTESGEDLSYFDQEAATRYLPYVVEPAAGVDRLALTFMIAAYREEVVNDEVRAVLALSPKLSPYKVAVLPLSKNEKLVPLARQINDIVRPRFMSDYDQSGAIGRRYRRQDEIGTPYCVTIDFDTLEDQAVTVRDRDTMNQDRVSIDKLLDYLNDHLQLDS